MEKNLQAVSEYLKDTYRATWLCGNMEFQTSLELHDMADDKRMIERLEEVSHSLNANSLQTESMIRSLFIALDILNEMDTSDELIQVIDHIESVRSGLHG